MFYKLILLATELLLTGVFVQAMHYDTIHYAVDRDDVAAIRQFLKQDHNLLNKQDIEGNTPLHNAAALGHIEVVRLLCHQPGIRLNEKNNNGNPPLFLAITRAIDRFLIFSLHHVNDINNPTDTEFNSSYFAEYCDSENIIRMLLLHGATPINHPLVVKLTHDVQSIREAWHRAQLSMMMGLHHRTGVASPLGRLSIDMIRQMLSYMQSEDFQEIALH